MTALFYQAASKSALAETISAFFRDLAANLEKSSRAAYEAHRSGAGGF